MDERKTGRRDMLSLLGASGVGVVFSQALTGCQNQLEIKAGSDAKGAAAAAGPKRASPHKDFFFLQVTDMHIGFKGPANPESDVTLKNAVKLINTSTRQPDFVVFTGDLTHTTDDVTERKKRHADVKAILSDLNCKNLKFLPGEHDGALDQSAVFKDHFGETTWSFSHEGIHFIGLDNASDLDGGLGDKQLAWLETELNKLPADQPIVVFAHRPLFPLMQQWEWWTKDGWRAIGLLQKRKNVTVFYGHIHQEHHYRTGHITHHASRSMVFRLPVAGSVPKRAPIPWKPENPDKGIGFRQVVVDNAPQLPDLALTDFTHVGARLPQWQMTQIVSPIPGPQPTDGAVALETNPEAIRRYL